MEVSVEESPVLPDFFDAVSRTAQFDSEAAFRFIGVRAFIMSASTIADLVDDLYLMLGERFVDARMYMGGRRAGERTAAALLAAYKLDPNDKRAAEKLFTDFYAALGWANLEFQLDYSAQAGCVVARNSFLAQGARAKFTAQGKATAVEDVRPAARCAMLGGYVAGLVSNLLEAEIDVRETECLATDNSDCRFQVASERLYTVKT